MSRKLDAMMANAVRDGVFPGGQLLVSRGGEILHLRAYGVTDIIARRPVTERTFFDLASLTKPLATTLAVMKLVDEGKLSLSGTLGRMLPPLAERGKGRIHLSNLLCHDSGLPAHRPYYETLRAYPGPERRAVLWRLLAEEPLVHPVGEQTVYSDLGFMVLALAVEAAAGGGMDRFLKEAVYEPLGIDGLHFPGGEGMLAGRDYAATERCPWRERLLAGEVHDDNAFALGGVCGHAGLFGTAKDVHSLLLELLAAERGGGGRVLEGGLVSRFLAPWGDGGRSLGFDLVTKVGSSSGRHFSKRTVGHLGFTGTSFWMDLAQGIIVILLTNRVHPGRENTAIRSFRPLLHDAVMEGLLGRGPCR